MSKREKLASLYILFKLFLRQWYILILVYLLATVIGGCYGSAGFFLGASIHDLGAYFNRREHTSHR